VRWRRSIGTLKSNAHRRASQTRVGGRAGSAAGHVIVQRIGPPGLSVRGVVNDRVDLLHDITAGAAGSISQQILDRSADPLPALLHSGAFETSTKDSGLTLGMGGAVDGEAPTAPVVQWVSGLRLGGSVG
jgi:hypothetical protein